MNSRRLHSITSSARASRVRRHVEAERLGGLEVDDQLELGRLLHRQVGRLLALEDAIDIAGCALVEIDIVDAIGCQSAADHVVTERVNAPAIGGGPPAR